MYYTTYVVTICLSEDTIFTFSKKVLVTYIGRISHTYT